MDFNLIILRSVTLHHCPECHSVGTLDRVRINSLWDKILLKVFQLRSYHCRECRWSGKVFLYKIRNQPGRIILNYLMIAAFFIAFIIIMNIMMKK